MKRPVTGLELLGRLGALHFDVDIQPHHAMSLHVGMRATVTNQQGEMTPKSADAFEYTNGRHFEQFRLAQIPAPFVIRDMGIMLAEVLAGAVEGISETAAPDPADLLTGRLAAQQARIGLFKAVTAVRAGLGELLLMTSDARVIARVEKMLEVLSPNPGCLRCGQPLSGNEPVNFVNNLRPYLGGMHYRCIKEAAAPPEGTPP